MPSSQQGIVSYRTGQKTAYTITCLSLELKDWEGDSYLNIVDDTEVMSGISA